MNKVLGEMFFDYSQDEKMLAYIKENIGDIVKDTAESAGLKDVFGILCVDEDTKLVAILFSAEELTQEEVDEYFQQQLNELGCGSNDRRGTTD